MRRLYQQRRAEYFVGNKQIREKRGNDECVAIILILIAIIPFDILHTFFRHYCLSTLHEHVYSQHEKCSKIYASTRREMNGSGDRVEAASTR